MELRHLRYFIALAGTLNFTRAAERVHVSQSTLSHQIKQLEDELGVRLFDRIGKRVVLTESGDEFLEYARRALREIDQGLGALKQLVPNASGELRIGATHSFNLGFIPDCIATFHQRHPDVKVVVEELAADLIAARLQDSSLDLGIAYRPATSESLQFEPLYNEEMVLVVRQDHPLARRKRVRMVELHRLPLVLLPPSFATRQLLDECFRACGAEPLVVAEMNTLGPMMSLVAKTGLACIVTPNAMPANSGLKLLRLESPTPVRTPGMLWAAGATKSAATRAFSTIVRKLAFRTSLLDAAPAG
ncbi:transcriptional regulator CynR [Caldimonas tepidiphila]|uniref:transcriptional regulator CynR n=1 Tax=Caldimonas tepidiphila TaxID=2315841 RepID=UPI000E5B2528|nr:transcriptional regulator CynR [Caldimonas tepidiphila]